MGQYLTSSPKTCRKFLLIPKLNPFLSVPWRNTGARTASEETHTKKKKSQTHGDPSTSPPTHQPTYPVWTCSCRRASSGRWRATPGWLRTSRPRRTGTGCGTWPECLGGRSVGKTTHQHVHTERERENAALYWGRWNLDLERVLTQFYSTLFYRWFCFSASN